MLLSSETKMMLDLQKTRTSYGDIAFSCAAAKAWNDMPSDLTIATSLQIKKKKRKHTCLISKYI